jgi:hypothetical protein
MEGLLNEAGFDVIRFDLNFERSRARRLAKQLRNCGLALLGNFMFRIALGREAYGRMRMESKMPFGSLMFVVARKRA